MAELGGSSFAGSQREVRERDLLRLTLLSERAAHQLSTPLSIMAIVVGDLRDSSAAPPADWKQSIDTLWAQIELCRRLVAAMALCVDVERVAKIDGAQADQEWK